MSRYSPANFAPLAALAALAATGCTKPIPTEQTFVVKTAVAPGLPEPEDDEPSARSLHRGDIVTFNQRGGPLKWAGTIDGEKVAREGTWIEVRRAPRDGGIYTFESELEPVAIPSAGWFCSTSPSPIILAGMACAEVINRIRIDARRLVGFLPCSSPGCPLGIADGKATRWTTIDGLSKLELRPFSGRPLLLASRGWLKAPGLSGSSLAVLEPSLALETRLDVVIEEIDARNGKTVISRAVHPVFEPDGFTLVGVKREVDKKTGADLSSTPVNERYRIDAEGHVSGP